MKKLKINNYSDTDYKKFKKNTSITCDFNISNDDYEYEF